MTDTEAAWQQLQQAGKVPPPDPSALERGREEYLRRAATQEARPEVPYRSRTRSPLLFIGAAAAAALVVGLAGQLTGIYDDQRTVAKPASSAAPSGPPTVSPESDAPGKQAGPTLPGPTMTIGAGGSGMDSLVAPFAEPTFLDFTKTDYVADLVEGVVVAATSEYIESRDDGSIVTQLTLRVERSRSGMKPGSTITVFQPGGIVPKKVMQKYLEEKFGPLSDKELRGFVEERLFGQEPSAPGDTVLVAVGADGVKPSPMAVATLTEIANGVFSWGVTPPNDSWSEQITNEQVHALLRQ